MIGVDDQGAGFTFVEKKEIERVKIGYLYVSVKDTDKSVQYYCDVFGAKLLWRMKKFGSVVAALQFNTDDPILLLNDHHPPPRTELIFLVEDAKKSQEKLQKRGARNLSPPLEAATGIAAVFTDLDENPLAITDHSKLEAFLKSIERERKKG